MSEEHKAKISAANKGKIRTPEQNLRNSMAKRGDKHPLFGKKRPKEFGEKLSEILTGRECPWSKGKKRSAETCSKISAANMGRVRTQEQNDIHSRAMKEHWAEHPMTEEHRKKLSDAKKGKPGNSSGFHYSDETRAMWSSMRRGSKHWNWRGGIADNGYGIEFTEELKELIRERDGFLCQGCGLEQLSGGEKLSVHHIDYDRRNNDPDNLISLCRECHGKTNSREHRGYYFLEPDVTLSVTLRR